MNPLPPTPPNPNPLDSSAEPHIEIALEIAKREIQANQHCMQGNLSHDQCDFTSSVTHYTAALKINPHHMESLANRASSYVAVGCFDLAIADTSRIIDLKEDDKSELSEVFYTRAEAFYHTKQYYDSLRDCDDALMFRPGFVGEKRSGAIEVGRVERGNYLGCGARSAFCMFKANPPNFHFSARRRSPWFAWSGS